MKVHKGALAWLWRVSGAYKGNVALLAALQIIFGICGVVFALLFRDLVNHAVAGEDGLFLATILKLAALELGETVLGLFSRFLDERTRASLENRFKERLFSCLLRKDYGTVTAVHSGEWVSRLTSDTVIAAGGVTDILPAVSGMLARLSGALVALYVLEPAFCYVLVPFGLLLLLVTASFRKILKSLHKKIQEANGVVLAFFQERLESLMMIRVFSMEAQTSQAAAGKMERHKAARMKRNHFSSLCNSGFRLAVDGCYLAGAVYCGWGIMKGTVSYGTFTAVLQLIGQAQSPFALISGFVPRYYAMTASAERLMEAEDYEDDQTGDPVAGEEIRRFYQEEFLGFGVRDASFSYRTFEGENPSRGRTEVIRHLNVEIHKGEYVAFTGHSGCGKSTLLKLFMCLYPMDGGERYLKARKKEGTVLEYPLTPAFRGLFAYVPQGNQLMSGTIRQIVAFGEPEAMKQEGRLRRALSVACADEFVAALEKGVDTQLGERGCGLSEGQMQRIAIARAVFSERPILILDESTSALDESTEQRLLTNLRRMTDQTVLIITHRPAALGICDREIRMTNEHL